MKKKIKNFIISNIYAQTIQTESQTEFFIKKDCNLEPTSVVILR